MALKLAGEEIGIQEKIETIIYNPGLPDSGDLEADTKTITATSEASGLENADYSKTLTLPKPSDSRLVVKRIALRLAVTIDSFDTATILYCRVYVDAQDADHLLFDENWNSTGAKLAVEGTHAGAKEVIFDLLKDGAAHTFYFFFWVNQANNAVISQVQLCEGVGKAGTDAWDLTKKIFEINHTGFIQIQWGWSTVGTGTPDGAFYLEGTTSWKMHLARGADNAANVRDTLFLTKGATFFHGFSSVATDLSYLSSLNLVLRSEQ